MGTFRHSEGRNHESGSSSHPFSVSPSGERALVSGIHLWKEPSAFLNEWNVRPSPYSLESLSRGECLSSLSEPNDESGANVDASKMWRDDREQFYKIAKQIVQKSLGL